MLSTVPIKHKSLVFGYIITLIPLINKLCLKLVDINALVIVCCKLGYPQDSLQIKNGTNVTKITREMTHPNKAFNTAIGQRLINDNSSINCCTWKFKINHQRYKCMNGFTIGIFCENIETNLSTKILKQIQNSYFTPSKQIEYYGLKSNGQLKYFNGDTKGKHQHIEQQQRFAYSTGSTVIMNLQKQMDNDEYDDCCFQLSFNIITSKQDKNTTSPVTIKLKDKILRMFTTYYSNCCIQLQEYAELNE